MQQAHDKVVSKKLVTPSLSIFFVKKPRPDGKTGVRRREYRFHVGVESAQHSPHTAVMGKVIVRIKLTNLFDLAVQKRGASKARPRQTEVEALVDTGATRLYLKPSVIKRLGLQRVDTVRSQTTNGEAMRYKYEPAQLELMGRKEMFDVMEARHAAPNRLGKAPLALLDFLLDRKRRKLISNPAHGGEQMTEEY